MRKHLPICTAPKPPRCKGRWAKSLILTERVVKSRTFHRTIPQSALWAASSLCTREPLAFPRQQIFRCSEARAKLLWPRALLCERLTMFPFLQIYPIAKGSSTCCFQRCLGTFPVFQTTQRTPVDSQELHKGVLCVHPLSNGSRCRSLE